MDRRLSGSSKADTEAPRTATVAMEKYMVRNVEDVSTADLRAVEISFQNKDYFLRSTGEHSPIKPHLHLLF
jgi:hypothetical protein